MILIGQGVGEDEYRRFYTAFTQLNGLLDQGDAKVIHAVVKFLGYPYGAVAVGIGLDYSHQAYRLAHTPLYFVVVVLECIYVDFGIAPVMNFALNQ